METFVCNLVYVSLLFVCALTRYNNNNNYTLYKVTAFNSRERFLLYTLQMKNMSIIFLNGVTNEAATPMDVIVDNIHRNEFQTILYKHNIQFAKISTKLILKSFNKVILKQNIYSNIHSDFKDWESIEMWVEHILKKYPDVLQKIYIGKTYEKRNIFMLKLSMGSNKCGTFILSGEEGRDWISPAVTLNFMQDLLQNKHNMKILTYYDFYFIPILNPDGYEYSMIEDRFWARNRKVFFPQTICIDSKPAVGVNIDRNWYLSKVYNEDSECNSVYHGPKSLSEEESQALFNSVNYFATNIMAFINLRGFNRLVTIPYGHTFEYCNNYAILMEILESALSKVYEEHNTTYDYANTASFFYNFSGNIPDWVKEKFNIPIVYTVYMKHGDVALPQAKHIQPLSRQLSTLVKEVLVIAKDIYGPLYNCQSKYAINILSNALSLFLLILQVI